MGPGKPPNLTFGDSAAVALAASQFVLRQRHFDPFPQTTIIRLLTRILNRLPAQMRIGIADFISASIGRPKTGIDKLDPIAAAKWVVDGYPSDRYPGCIVGAPGLAATFLSGLTGFPFLPQPLLYNARRDMKLDDAQAYLDAGLELAEPLLAKYPDIEATIHYDPVHDRFLIKRLVFMRLKFLTLPPAYRTFIEKRLIPGSPVIILDCNYQWQRAEISKNCFYQLGGLGGFTPDDYIDEVPVLKDYRKDWGAPSSASWKIDRAYTSGPESEWGSTGTFSDEAEECCSGSDHQAIRVAHDHPEDLSRMVFNLYRNCWQGSTGPRDVYLGVFTHTEPRFPLVTGCLPLWVPFITEESYHFVYDTLKEWHERDSITEPSGSVYMTLHPSFCSPPDIVRLENWRTLLNEFFENVYFPGTDPGRHPSDLGCYVAMYPAIVSAAKREAYIGTPFRRPEMSMLAEVLLNKKENH